MNLTPDSFSKDGRLSVSNNLGAHVRYAQKLIAQGADIIDIGGESTRPGAQPISVQEEIKRIIPTIKRLAVQSSIPISVDTYKPDVAKAGLDAGAVMINNIMGIKPERRLLIMVREYNASIVLMHMRGTPANMQKKTKYKNLILDMIADLRHSVENCLEIGIKKDRIIIDPGIGFAKTPEQNLEILNRLNEFKILRRPILVGTSRKSFIGKVLKREVKDRCWGTAAAVAMSISQGANIVRVHDVKEMKDVAMLTDAIIRVK